MTEFPGSASGVMQESRDRFVLYLDGYHGNALNKLKDDIKQSFLVEIRQASGDNRSFPSPCNMPLQMADGCRRAAGASRVATHRRFLMPSVRMVSSICRPGKGLRLARGR